MVSWRKPLSGQMSEQQGKVIDGTARASHWRRSSPSSTPDADASPGHSEAPKNIASSLLVPAYMLLDSAAATASAGAGHETLGEGPGERPTGLVARAPGAADYLHVNLFLAAERAAELAATRGEASLLRRVQAVVRRPVDRVVGGSRGTAEGRRSWRIAPARTAARPITIAVATLGVLAALAVATTALWHSGAPGRHVQSVGRANALDSLKPNVLTASADPFGTESAAHRSGVVRSQHTNAPHLKKHSAAARTSIPVHTNGNQHVVMAHYTPSPTPTSSGSAPDTRSASGEGSGSPPASSTPHTSPSNPNPSSSSGSSSAAPSTATLRSLVTGAGTCGCQ
jgi:hypothetical protein